jgi:hypothetical protein
MNDRREFLTQASALAAIPWSVAAVTLSGQEAASEPLSAFLEWEFSDGWIHVKQGAHRMLTVLYPGYRCSGSWRGGKGLALLRSQLTYED